MPAMVPGVLTLLLTIVAGRVWCGWLCPLGTLLDWMPSRYQRKSCKDALSRWRKAKYYMLFILLFSTLFGVLTLMVFDPITLLSRSLTSVVMPLVDSFLGLLTSGLHRFGPIQGGVESFDGWLQASVLPLDQPFQLASLSIALVFVVVLVLNVARPRFWCRYLCPLGALLALASKVSWLRHRVEESRCVSCGQCTRVCPTGTIDSERKYGADSVECTMCMKCLAACPTSAVSFDGMVPAVNWQKYDPSRRQALASLGIAVAGVAILRTVPAVRRTNLLCIRPPGADENSILNRCIRCGECVKVCPTGGLQHGFTTSGWDGPWTPVLVSRLGYCDYSCNACGLVCPTGAIPKLLLEEKRRVVIGVAEIDRARCIPWVEDRDCIVCEEMCPVPDKAIELRHHVGRGHGGRTTDVLRPEVVSSKCIGCGICEKQCPVNGEAAIRVKVKVQ
jgi:polyferredoxin